MKPRTLIVVRHGHRDTEAGREKDNGLSEKGKEQAKAVGRLFRLRYPKAHPLLLASPKVRCIQTLIPLGDKVDVEVKVLDLLDEQSESESAFKRRLDKFYRWWKQRAPETTVVCSHGDWIPVFTEHVLGAPIDLKKGGWLELESDEEGRVRIRWVLQKLD